MQVVLPQPAEGQAPARQSCWPSCGSAAHWLRPTVPTPATATHRWAQCCLRVHTQQVLGGFMISSGSAVLLRPCNPGRPPQGVQPSPVAPHLHSRLTLGAVLQLAKAGELSAALVAFLTGRGGSVPSADVVSHFSDRVGPAEAPLFKHLLHQASTVGPTLRRLLLRPQPDPACRPQVAQLRRVPEGGKQWVLSPDFAAQAGAPAQAPAS